MHGGDLSGGLVLHLFDRFVLQRRRDVQPVVGRHAEAVALCVLADQAAFDEVALHGQGGRLAGAVHEGAAEGPSVVQLIAGHHAHVVAAVPAAGEGFAVVDVGELAFGLAPGVAHPAGELSQAALQEELGTVAPAFAEHEGLVVVGVAAALRAGPFGVLDLVGHVLVVQFDAALVLALLQVAEPAQGVLYGFLRLHVLSAGDPGVRGQADGAETGEVDVLQIPVEAGFHAVFLVNGVAHGKPWFQPAVLFDDVATAVVRGADVLAHVIGDILAKGTHMGEPAEAQPGVDAEPVGDIEIILDVHRCLVRIELGRRVDVEVHIPAVHRHGAGRVDVVGVLEAVAHVVADVRILVEVHLQAVVADAAAELEAELVLVPAEGELVIAEDGGGVEEELGAEDVVPAAAHRGVSPGDLEVRAAGLVAAEVEHVAPEVTAEEEAVLVAETVVGLGVEVVEIVAAAGELAFLVDERLGQDVNISAACADDEGAFLLHDRPFQRKAAADDADPALPVEFLVIAVLHGDRQHAAGPSAVVGGHAALDQLDVLYRVRIEHAEKAEEMAGVVHRGLVQQDQVLVRAAAAHIEAAVTLPVALHAGQVLDRLQDVHLAQQRGQRLQLGDVHVHAAHVRGFRLALGPFALHLHGFHHLHHGAELQVHLPVRGEVHPPLHVRIAHVFHHQRIGARLQRGGVVTVVVGGHALVQLLNEDGGPDQRLAGGGIGDITAH